MKIDRRNPRHLLSLAVFAAMVLISLLLRAFSRRRRRPLVVLYGHKLNGNLAALLHHVRAREDLAVDLTFLTMDRAYCRELAGNGVPTTLATSFECCRVLAACDAVVSDHGLHALEIALRFRVMRFFDVWHGIPFKGFDAADFRVQHAYDEVWVASPLVAALYAERFGFRPERVMATGYPRTDRLVLPTESIETLRADLGLASTRGRRIVLFAPTWKQDDAGRSLIPFGLDPEEFFTRLGQVCARHQALVLFRAHLNSRDAGLARSAQLVEVPHSIQPDTEGLLQLADVLVCDWSSIAFDFLLLDRPTIFLDVEPPFTKGFSLGPEYRFGAVTRDIVELESRLDQVLGSPESYRDEFAARHAECRSRVYGGMDDGRSSRRCADRLAEWLVRDGSSR